MNKKIYLVVTLIAVLFFSACEDVYDHLAADPQSYEQEDQQSINGFTFALMIAGLQRYVRKHLHMR